MLLFLHHPIASDTEPGMALEYICTWQSETVAQPASASEISDSPHELIVMFLELEENRIDSEWHFTFVELRTDYNRTHT